MINGYIIRAYMREAGVTVKDIASSLSVSKPFVSQVVHNVKRNQRVREAISKAVNKPVSDLWPDKQKEAT
jgi:predicted transcriptional regulator